jgi:tetratricopeptide (TPR) repeat protein
MKAPRSGRQTLKPARLAHSKRMKLRLFLLAFASLVAGCTNPLNMYTADRYYQLGVAAENRGDLENACMFFSRSYGNTLMGFAPPLARAHALYEYARVSGYLGRLAEAEKGFQEVIVLLDKVPDDPSHLRAPTHSEHAKLLFANKRYRESLPEFEKAVANLDQLSVEAGNPGDYAAFLEKYAAALRVAGKDDQAQVIRQRVEKIHRDHSGAPVSPESHRYLLADEIPSPSPLVTPLTSSAAK